MAARTGKNDGRPVLPRIGTPLVGLGGFEFGMSREACADLFGYDPLTFHRVEGVPVDEYGRDQLYLYFGDGGLGGLEFIEGPVPPVVSIGGVTISDANVEEVDRAFSGITSERREDEDGIAFPQLGLTFIFAGGLIEGFGMGRLGYLV